MSTGSGASHDITALLVAWSKGHEAALESLVPLVDQELRRIARRYLEGEDGQPRRRPAAGFAGRGDGGARGAGATMF